MCHESIENFFQHRHVRALQFGGSTKNGATNMFHLLSCIVQTVPQGVPLGGPAHDPLMVLALDCTNATDDQDQPVGWDLLWSYINAHYGVKGVLKYYHGGNVHLFSSDAGVHQGDPIAGTLFALAIHPIIIKLAEDYDVVVTAYSDNIIM